MMQIRRGRKRDRKVFLQTDPPLRQSIQASARAAKCVSQREISIPGVLVKNISSIFFLPIHNEKEAKAPQAPCLLANTPDGRSVGR